MACRIIFRDTQLTLKLEKSAISKLQKHIIFAFSKMAKKSIFAPEKTLKLPKM